MSMAVRKRLMIGAVSLAVAAVVLFACAAISHWAEFNLDLPAQDCLMNTWKISGEVKDQNGSLIPNARISITGRGLMCENGIQFQATTTDAQGRFELWQTFYSPINKSLVNPNPTEAFLSRLPNGTYEIVVSADGYETYFKADATDDDIFHEMTVILTTFIQ